MPFAMCCQQLAALCIKVRGRLPLHLTSMNKVRRIAREVAFCKVEEGDAVVDQKLPLCLRMLRSGLRPSNQTRSPCLGGLRSSLLLAVPSSWTSTWEAEEMSRAASIHRAISVGAAASSPSTRTSFCPCSQPDR